MNTAVSSADPRGPYRAKTPKLWQVLAGAVLLHVIVVLAFSPNLGKARSDTPDGLLAEARSLREQGKFEDAFARYQDVMSKKPPVPVLFTEAENEMNDVRAKALDAKRKAQEQQAKEQPKDDKKEQGTGKKPGPDQPGQAPKVDTPMLPEIGIDM